MKALGKFVANVMFYTISAGLFVYAASRSLHFIQSTLNENDQILGYFALLATSGGMLGWLAVFLMKADGLIQRGTAMIMVMADFLGEAALFTMDTLYESGRNGIVAPMSQNEIRTVIIAMSALIAVNILAIVVFHVGNMEVLREIASMSQRDTLFFKSMQQIDGNADALASELTPGIVEDWKRDFTQKYGSGQGIGLVNKQPNPQESQVKSWINDVIANFQKKSDPTVLPSLPERQQVEENVPVNSNKPAPRPIQTGGTDKGVEPLYHPEAIGRNPVNNGLIFRTTAPFRVKVAEDCELGGVDLVAGQYVLAVKMSDGNYNISQIETPTKPFAQLTEDGLNMLRNGPPALVTPEVPSIIGNNNGHHKDPM